MVDKCAAHDECFSRVHAKIEGSERETRDKLDELAKDIRTGLNDIKEALHRKELDDMGHNLRIEILEKKLSGGGVDWRRFFIDLLKDFIRFGFFAGGAAAWWAIRHGYTG